MRLLFWCSLVFLCSGVTQGHADKIPPYSHVFVIIAENKAFKDVIGNPHAPRLNALASKYGLATRYFGIVHPSLPNYIAMLGGDTFGIHDNDAWFCKPKQQDKYCRHSDRDDYVDHSLTAPSLMDQLEKAGKTWKGYFEDLPPQDPLAIVYPSEEAPDPSLPRHLYVAKHNGFVYFENVRKDKNLAQKIVPLSQLDIDLARDTAPTFAHIVLNQCNGMHGLPASFSPPPDCIIKRGEFDPTIGLGDAAIGALVDKIMAAPLWAKAENAAIVITFDEDNHSQGEQGCCGFDPKSKANFGGGHIATIVITNHGPRAVADPSPYNHYSLLRTLEDAFALEGYLGFAGAADKGVVSMAPLFAAPRR